MTIREANNKLGRLENELNYYIDMKNLAIDIATKKTSSPSSERTDGGTRQDKYKLLDISIDEYDPEIERLNKEIIIIRNYIESELKRIGEYEPLKAKIIKLREEKGMKWDDIAIATHYSKSQCRRIYSSFSGKRNVKDEHLMNTLIC